MAVSAVLTTSQICCWSGHACFSSVHCS